MSTKSIVNWMNKTFDFTNLLKSRIVLYTFFILSIAQLYTYSVTADYLSAVIFFLVGFLVSFFSKNMIVIMCFALSLSYMLKYGESMRNMQEGMKEGVTDATDKTDTKVSSGGLKTPEFGVPIKSSAAGEEELLEIKEKRDPMTTKAMSPGMDKETQMEYKNLLELQLKLIDGISNMQPVLSEVAQKIDSMKKTMKSPL